MLLSLQVQRIIFYVDQLDSPIENSNYKDTQTKTSPVDFDGHHFYSPISRKLPLAASIVLSMSSVL